ncbi:MULTISPECIES: DUF881 domain-containing protein [unclassified Bacillus (in: firmicutes)]|uniref:DUF881 domain-containing protein n=2 Tax=Bacillus TaxID=1386 RepID=UPI00047D3F33|nr:DUF881 domain-containing protein [Bacillus sp. NSP9.1]
MKKSNRFISLSVLMLIFGIMLSVQFNSLKEPEIRDTRDIWDLREDLKAEQKKQLNLISEIDKYEKMLDTYQQQEENSRIKALNDTLQSLKKQAGFTDVTGKGITIRISQLFSDELTGEPMQNPPPDLLKKLINELNMYEAEDISINDRRVINTTVIRDINGTTKIDGYPLDNYPITVKVIGKNADKLYSRMNASTLQDLFAGENLDLQIEKPEKQIKIKAYEGSMQTAPLKPIDKSKGENS